MSVQTSCAGALNFFETVAEAYTAMKNNPQLDKISFTDDEGMHRYRPKLKRELWNPKSEATMCRLSTDYRMADDDQLFWVDQPMDIFCDCVARRVTQETLLHLVAEGEPIPSHLKEYQYLLKMEPLDEDDCYSGSIVNVFTVEEFEIKYKC